MPTRQKTMLSGSLPSVLCLQERKRLDTCKGIPHHDSGILPVKHKEEGVQKWYIFCERGDRCIDLVQIRYFLEGMLLVFSRAAKRRGQYW
jgi:hypothetical protein